MPHQITEIEGVELAGVAGVFSSLVPDNAPSGVAEPPESLTPLPTLEQTLVRRLTGGKMPWDGDQATSEADKIPKTRMSNIC